MSDILKSAGADILTTSETLYTAPTATTVIGLSGGVYNGTESTITITLTINKNTGGTIPMITGKSIVAGESYEFPPKTILEPLDTISGIGSAIGATMYLNHVEHGDVVVDVTQAHTDALAASASAAAAAISETNAANSAASAMQDVVDDTTPTLGGDLDCNDKVFLESSYNQIADASLGTGTHTFDYSLGDMQQLTMTGDITIAFSGFPVGKVSSMIVDIVNGGDWTPVYPAGTIFSGKAEPTMTSGGTDRVLIIKDKDEVYSFLVVGNNIGVVA